MKDLLILIAHLLTTIAKLLGPGGARAIVADSLLTKHGSVRVERPEYQAGLHKKDDPLICRYLAEEF